MSEIASKAGRETGVLGSSCETTTMRWGWKRVDASVKRTEKESIVGVSDSYKEKKTESVCISRYLTRLTASSLDHIYVTTSSALLNESVDLRSVKNGTV